MLADSYTASTEQMSLTSKRTFSKATPKTATDHSSQSWSRTDSSPDTWRKHGRTMKQPEKRSMTYSARQRRDPYPKKSRKTLILPSSSHTSRTAYRSKGSVHTKEKTT